jgi:uncharacterized protein (DUF2249 family)
MNQVVQLDVREYIVNGGHPFQKIMDAVAKLAANEKLMVIAPFEPVPLISILERQGFSHSANRLASGDWEVVFSRSTAKTEQPPIQKGSPKLNLSKTNESIELDARGLEPPQPMVRILEALGSMPEGTVLHAKTDRRPMHLYAQLEARGFVGETEQLSDGSYITHIRRG